MMTPRKALVLVYWDPGSNLERPWGIELTRIMKAQMQATMILTARPPTAIEKTQILHVK
jgi:hypothetical protein